MVNFAKVFKSEAFQNTAGIRIEAGRPIFNLYLIFGEWPLGKLAEVSLLYRKIEFSDEAHFCLNGYISK